nr:ABC transporter ATP-binding protein [Chloroflexia bacterium]
PQHPYTQLLIDSIPAIDPSKTWKKEKLVGDPSARVSTAAQGCKFADRCPYVMDICRDEAPPLFRTDEGRAAACFLYRDRPQLGGSDMNQVLGTHALAVPEGAGTVVA